MLIFLAFISLGFSLSTTKTTIKTSPFSKPARITRENGDPAPIVLMRTFGSIVSDCYRYYLGDVRFFKTEYGPSEHYQRLMRDNVRSTVTSPSCPVTNDPLPSGGANCTNDRDCNSVNQGGLCDISGTSAGTCVCANGWGKPDCSYRRTSKDLAGGLQIGLVFAGVGGVGNFIIGRTGPAVGQLILMLGYYLCCISFCLMACDLMVPGVVLIIVAACAYLAGFIWAIVDGAFILQCVYTDALGYALY